MAFGTLPGHVRAVEVGQPVRFRGDFERGANGIIYREAEQR